MRYLAMPYFGDISDKAIWCETMREVMDLVLSYNMKYDYWMVQDWDSIGNSEYRIANIATPRTIAKATK